MSFETSEGTWISLDVSPDGKAIVFELLGDLYTLPIAGGAATRITSGPGFDSQPRWSPDGKRIVFLSDRSGAENVWLCDPDGSHSKALTKGTNNLYASPDWTPDGKYIVVSRTSGVLGSVYELWLITPGGKADPAGVFVPDASGGKVVVVGQSLAGYNLMAVTVEAGPDGVGSPTQQPEIYGTVA